MNGDDRILNFLSDPDFSLEYTHTKNQEPIMGSNKKQPKSSVCAVVRSTGVRLLQQFGVLLLYIVELEKPSITRCAKLHVSCEQYVPPLTRPLLEHVQAQTHDRIII